MKRRKGKKRRDGRSLEENKREQQVGQNRRKDQRWANKRDTER